MQRTVWFVCVPMRRQPNPRKLRQKSSLLRTLIRPHRRYQLGSNEQRLVPILAHIPVYGAKYPVKVGCAMVVEMIPESIPYSKDPTAANKAQLNVYQVSFGSGGILSIVSWGPYDWYPYHSIVNCKVQAYRTHICRPSATTNGNASTRNPHEAVDRRSEEDPGRLPHSRLKIVPLR